MDQYVSLANHPSWSQIVDENVKDIPLEDRMKTLSVIMKRFPTERSLLSVWYVLHSLKNFLLIPLVLIAAIGTALSFKKYSKMRLVIRRLDLILSLGPSSRIFYPNIGGEFGG